MTEKETGGPAFPVRAGYGNEDTTGITMRDYFAAKAMQGIVSVLHQGIRPTDLSLLAKDSYAVADAMLKERNK